MSRPILDDRDPAPETVHEPVSSEWARRAALEACEQAVNAAKERRGKKYGGTA